MNLFKDFQSVSSKAWKQKIQMDLKGADYNTTLINQTNDAIKIKPFYHSDNFKSLEIPDLNNDFSICQTVFIADEKIACNIAINALNKGATTIRFIANKVFDLDFVLNQLKKQTAFNFIFNLNFLDEKFNSKIKKINTKLNCIFNLDVIGNYAKNGNWFKSQILDINNTKIKNSISINANLYQNAGANKAQQIAYALSHLNEYLNANILNNNTLISCTFSVSSDYFFEISKLRAFRYLFNKLVAEYNTKPQLQIIVEPSLRNKTIYDYNINMLRTTTECMSAILGGADIISNVSYDTIYHKSNDFGERIARNQLIILKEESYFNEASNIAKGSYYIEQLTYELTENSLKLFKEIENNGGFITQLKKGTIQRKINESANKEQLQFNANEIILVGTNKFSNENDKMKDNLQLFPFVKKQPRQTSIQPIIPKRLAEKLEQERLKQEK